MYGIDYESDCAKCAYSTIKDDGGGEYEDIILHCDKMNRNVTYVGGKTPKPCTLNKGEYYQVSITVKKQ